MVLCCDARNAERLFLMQKEDNIRAREMDFINLLNYAWRYKWVVIVVTLVCGLAAYVIGRNSEVQASLILRAPVAGDIASLLIERPMSKQEKLADGTMTQIDENLIATSPDSVFAQFISRIASADEQFRFFKKNISKDSPGFAEGENENAEFMAFRSRLAIGIVPGEPPAQARLLTLKGTNAAMLEKWLPAYVQMIADATAQDLIDGTRRRIDARIHDLELKQVVLKQESSKELQDRARHLEQARSVANAIKLEHEAATPNGADASMLDNDLLYRRGATALTAQSKMYREILTDSQLLDAYTTGLRRNEGQLSYYRKVRGDLNVLRVHRSDSRAVLTSGPIRDFVCGAYHED